MKLCPRITTVSVWCLDSLMDQRQWSWGCTPKWRELWRWCSSTSAWTRTRLELRRTEDRDKKTDKHTQKFVKLIIQEMTQRLKNKGNKKKMSTLLSPSSSTPRCWERSRSWWRTQTEATPQTSTSCTGRRACSVACIWSVAWRWWQSQCKLSVWRQRQTYAVYKPSLNYRQLLRTGRWIIIKDHSI